MPPSRTTDRTAKLLSVFFGLIALMMTVTAWWWFAPAPPPVASGAGAPPPAAVAAPSIPKATIAAFFAALEADARARGISDAVLRKAFDGFTPDDEIAALVANQPEHVKSAGDYMTLLVSETRLATGRGKLIEHADLFATIEQRYGVDRHVVAAIWGVESSYGASMGERKVPRSLATLAMTDSRRSAFWRNELIAALSILERGDIAADAMTGSWAGAMGHTQFIPSTYLAHAADLDGDGRRNIWGPPGDALASTANYLKASGWVTGQRPAVEVKLPAGFDASLSAPGTTRTWEEWRLLGLTPAVAATAPAEAETARPLGLILPAGVRGPAFLVGASFRAILRYNNAVSYALAVSHLADRLAGAAPLVTAWPADDKALSKTEREELQGLLTGLGHDAGAVDGVIGAGTRAAIRAFQKAKALPEDGHPNAALLTALRQAKATASDGLAKAHAK